MKTMICYNVCVSQAMNKKQNIFPAQYASRPGSQLASEHTARAFFVGDKMVNEMAVENFLSSVDLSMPQKFYLLNLESDAMSYKWSRDTVQAIRDGIIELYAKFGIRG